ncbi:hypothetical protein AYI70_g6091 [Smittium culicis]|uniref:Uncharacterized protein n=1 Tax=Smittium culicis TaxID=133412 RepID=A0A1R1XRK5_9FUNG|nr:hypothetical protein AYI70_g6091 [Smittium culicis]
MDKLVEKFILEIKRCGDFDELRAHLINLFESSEEYKEFSGRVDLIIDEYAGKTNVSSKNKQRDINELETRIGSAFEDGGIWGSIQSSIKDRMLSDPNFSALLNTKVSKSIEALESKQVIEFVSSETAESCGVDVVVGGIVVGVVAAQPDMRGLSLERLCESGSKAVLFAMEVTSVGDTGKTFKAKHLSYMGQDSTSSPKPMRVDGADKFEGEVSLDFSLAISLGDYRTVSVGDTVYAANTTLEQLQQDTAISRNVSGSESISADQPVKISSETDLIASRHNDEGISSVAEISNSNKSSSNSRARLCRATVVSVNFGRGLIAATFSDTNITAEGIISEFDTNLFVAANSIPKPLLALLQ